MTAHEIPDAHVKHAKLMSLLVTILLCDLALIAISVKVIGFAMFGMLLIMLYECWIILIEITQIILKYQMFLHEYYHRKFWEGREEIGYLLGSYLVHNALCSLTEWDLIRFCIGDIETNICNCTQLPPMDGRWLFIVNN